MNKFELLDTERQKQLLDYLDFLLFQQKTKHAQEFNYQEYKHRILTISPWTEEDVANIEDAKKAINKWQAQEW